MLTQRSVKLASMLMFLPDAHALGLETAQVLICSEAVYWNPNGRTRGIAQRARGPGRVGATLREPCWGLLSHLA